MATENFKNETQLAINTLTSYLENSKQGSEKVINQMPIREISEVLNITDFLKNGGLKGPALEQFLINYLNLTTKLHNKNYLAHQISNPNTNGVIASFVDGLTNNETSIYEMGPAATTIEFYMINWMLEKIGWDAALIPSEQSETSNNKHGGGVLTNGGSLANLTAMLAARNAQFPNYWKEGSNGNIVILVPEQSHYSLKRTAGIMGLGEENCISMPADDDGRVLPQKVPELINMIKGEGKQVMAIVGNACGTAAGLYDPLDQIGAVCQEHGIWFHVDAAHGAGAIVCKEYRYLVAGIEKADSIIWDAHKMFRTPALCAAILVKDYKTLDGAFSQDASYLHHDKEEPGIDYFPKAVECTKTGLGLKMFMAIAETGEKGIEEYISGRNALAQKAEKYINGLEDFECPVSPETNILCFRIGKDDQRQLDIRKILLQNGDYFISTTKYKESRWLRCVFMNPETDMEVIKNLISEIRKINSELDN